MTDQWVKTAERAWYKAVTKAAVTTRCDVTRIGPEIYAVVMSQKGQVDPNVAELAFQAATLTEAQELGDALIEQFANESLPIVEFNVGPLPPFSPLQRPNR